MPSTTCFTAFQQNIDGYLLPERFTFPFYYQPHPLALLAAEQLQQYLNSPIQFQTNFAITEPHESSLGKMFGVLVVENLQGKIGYLSAFSGNIKENISANTFVPPVYAGFSEEPFFIEQQSIINQLNSQIDKLSVNTDIARLKQLVTTEKVYFSQVLTAQQTQMQAARKARKAQRVAAEITLNELEYSVLKTQLAKQSIADKYQLNQLKTCWQEKINIHQQQLDHLLNEIEPLKQQRKRLSTALQQQLFTQYMFLNQQAEQKSLTDIFRDTAFHLPPAGAGECAAPKLLQYAFKYGMKPLALAEFWWGKSPKSEIRQHKNYYPACNGKCRPILSHMLAGMKIDNDPLLVNPAIGKTLEIVYQDETLLVVNKPAEFLSVPGKSITDSVLTRIQQQFPHCDSPFIVHRLDMSTSGLMVIALDKIAHKKLQKQFIERRVKKHYVAILEGISLAERGVIKLPLRGDLNDRPRQLVCELQGKTAETHWQLLNVDQQKQQTRLKLTPLTGRTHQLRVHCAHIDGLNMSIVGDDLYGKKAQRLYLHAQYLAFEHPLTKKRVSFEIKADF